MTYRNYEFTAFAEADLLSPGDTNLGCGDSFTMPASATTCITVCDDDAFLSGDSCHNENADDHTGQKATIEGPDGEEGNGGQIYAESYYWVQDQHGNKYVMIEIEQEGRSGDYFTFHNAYGMPPAGAELTIVSKGNVTSNWIDYKCLDAGEKVELGSISGSVFCDVNCDGIDGTQTVIAGHDYTIEAEDMHLYNMRVFHGDRASGGEGVKLNCAGDTGAIWTDFGGKTGTYDVKIRIQDETDGRSVVKLKVDGVLVDAFRLDRDSNGGGSNNSGFSTFVIRDVEINQGSQIKLVAYGDGHEFVRIDKLRFEGQDEVVNTPEPDKEGVLVTLLDADGEPVLGADGQPITTTTAADGTYHFNDIPAGDYRVKFTNPDGTAFTLQDQGGDDAIDSDVGADGVSGVITVAGGQDVTDVDAGLKVAFRECDDPNAVKIDFEGFAAGTVIDDEYEGVSISAQRATNNTAANDAMIFDSANPTGGDTDLATAMQGNILIVSEDNDSSDPDDAIGGTITFAFDNPANVFDLKVVDAEEGGTINLFDADGNAIGSVAIPNGVDGGLQQVIIDTDGVARMEVVLNGSGAIDDLCYVPGEPAPGSLSGRYFIDENRNDQDDGEPGVAGVTVDLLDADGNVIGSTTTAADGSYSFGDLAPGTYSVKFTDAVSGRTLVDQNVGDDATDSDARDLGGGMSIIEGIAVNAGENTPDNDAGVEDIPGSLSGTYFCDVNENDVNDAGDVAEAGRTVKLLNADGTEARDIDGNLVPPTETDANGNYRFTNLAAGSYVVMFGIPDTAEGKEFVAPDVGDDATDSDVLGQTGMTAPVQVFAGQETENVDAGIADINDAPVAVDDAGMVCVGESTVIDLLVNDSDTDGDTLVVTSLEFNGAIADEVGESITLASGATATLNANGTVSIDASAAAPELLLGDTLLDEFIYHVSDGEETVEAGVDLTLKGAKNTLEMIDGNLGEVGVVTGELFEDNSVGGTLFTLDVTDVEFPDTVLGEVLSATDPLELVFCLSIGTPIELAPGDNTFTVAVLDSASYSDTISGAFTVDGNPDFGFNPENIDNVNWLLNEATDLITNQGYTEGEIQRAIWNLVDGGDDSVLDSTLADAYFATRPEYGDFATAKVLSDLALANDGFIAGEGDQVGVLFDPVADGVQPLVAVIDFEDLKEDCIC